MKTLTLALFLLSSYLSAWDIGRTLTVIVEGCHSKSVSTKGLFGVSTDRRIVRKVASVLKELEGAASRDITNQVVMVRYYGDTSPLYYSPEDIAEVNQLTGLPRYAVITAKFIRHQMRICDAAKVNLIGASYGGLITRYLIEKNLENLASAGIISRWLTLGGVVCGSKLLDLPIKRDSQKLLEDFLALTADDIDSMNPTWVRNNFESISNSRSPFFKSIHVGHQVPSRGRSKSILNLFTSRANDSLFLVEDMFLQRLGDEKTGRYPQVMITDTSYFSGEIDNHLLYIIKTFLTGDRLVRICLENATIKKLPEDQHLFGEGEVFFQTDISSIIARNDYGVQKPIAVRNRTNQTAHKVLCEVNEQCNVEMTIFDWIVDAKEEALEICISAEEVDWDERYGIMEDLFQTHEELGNIKTKINVLEEGSQTLLLENEYWTVTIEVEVTVLPLE